MEGQYELNHGYMMMLDGWTNCWDSMPEEEGIYLVEDHSGKRGKAKAVKSFGHIVWEVSKWCSYDICFWKAI